MVPKEIIFMQESKRVKNRKIIHQLNDSSFQGKQIEKIKVKRNLNCTR